MAHIVAIVGPTGVGKSRLALCLAQTFDGEIVSADSRQVYRHMDIGTAKPTRQDLSLKPHHLIDIIDPDEDFNLTQYQHLAYKAINDTQQRNKLPLLVGGSGLYVWSVLEGWQVPVVPPDARFRQSMESKVVKLGREALYEDLVRVDPVAAQNIDPRNVRRVIRALEVHKHTGTPYSQLQQKQAPPYEILIFGLTTERTELYRLIDSRVDGMIERGLVDEVRKLVDMGYDLSLPSISSIGYRQIGMFLKGELTLDTAIQQIKNETHRFVRHQYSWFRLKDDRIRWFDIQGDIEPEITSAVAEFTKG
jgi:tRNA dimethylallyltransferase